MRVLTDDLEVGIGACSAISFLQGLVKRSAVLVNVLHAHKILHFDVYVQVSIRVKPVLFDYMRVFVPKIARFDAARHLLLGLHGLQDLLEHRRHHGLIGH